MSLIRFEADQPNERWQAETCGAVADGSHIQILDIIDDRSRLAGAYHAGTTLTAADVVNSFDHAFARYGLPAIRRSAAETVKVLAHWAPLS